MDDFDDKSKQSGKLISFPNGEKVSTDELGSDYILDQSGVIPTPEVVDTVAIQREYRDRENFVQSQELVRGLSAKIPLSDVVDVVLVEIAEELSHLKFERQKAAKEGKNTSNYTISRIASLKQLADVLSKRIESNKHQAFDLKSPQFKHVLRIWMEFVYESMQKCEVPEQVIDLVFRQIEADMVDYEKRVLESV
jgi:hypothetical protein